MNGHIFLAVLLLGGGVAAALSAIVAALDQDEPLVAFVLAVVAVLLFAFGFAVAFA
jgi:hypothetical protein